MKIRFEGLRVVAGVTAKTNGRGWRGVSGWMRAAGCALLFLLICQVSQGAPFRNLVVPFTQPDGTKVEVRGWGDEFSAVFETADGFTVVFDSALKAYCFAQKTADGHLVSSGVQIHKGSAAALGIVQHERMDAGLTKQLAQDRWQKWEQDMKIDQQWQLRKAAIRQYAASGIQGAPPGSTTLGNKAGLTLLVDFSDDIATIPQATIDDFCNGDNFTAYGNNGSVKKYYLDNSNGKLTYTNVVTIYVRVPNPKSYYNDVTMDSGTQANLLIKDALDALKALPNYTTDILPTFSSLTVDGNNQVVACNVFFAGDNSGVWTFGLWPHAWVLANVGAQDLGNGKSVWKYQISNIGTSLEIGTFCHENGHMLCGYPDLYDYGYDSVGGAGDFCLMAAGELSGGNPSQICAYLKTASGWATLTDLDSTSALTAHLDSAHGTNFNHFYRYQRPGVSTEYFLAECRNASGRDASLPASGIAIWHVDELGDRDNQSLVPNSVHANYELTLVQADNKWDFERNINEGDSNDLYYAENSAAQYGNLFNNNSTPNSHWWDGTDSGVKWHDFSLKAPAMTFISGSSDLSYLTNMVIGGNGQIDYNECSALNIAITNSGDLDSTGIEGFLSSTTPGVFIAEPTASYPDAPSGAAITNRTPFKVSTAPTFVCGTTINFTLILKSDQSMSTNYFKVRTGVSGKPIVFAGTTSLAIPDADPVGVLSPVTVTNVVGALMKVTVALYITHTFDEDLKIELIAPNGSTVTLSDQHGSFNDNYGAICDVSGQTVFDDDATTWIGDGNAPFIGSFKPDQPLSVYIGNNGTNVNGVWSLHVVDQFLIDTGTLQCWSLALTPAFCTDGGGECAGADLSLAMSAAPNPVSLSNVLTYTMIVSNAGPSTAKGVSLSQNLPADSTFASAAMTGGGTYAVANGVLSCSWGTIPASLCATALVSVVPGKVGTISSAANVGSSAVDFNPANNWAFVTTVVEAPKADLSLTLNDTPDPVLAGGVLTYNISVLNRGPSSVSGLMVTNFLPATVGNISVVTSQGTAYTSGNTVLALLGALDRNGIATITITCTPLVYGQISATSVAVSDQTDPLPANNRATVITTVGPAADVSVAMVANPSPVLLGSNLTYSVTVSNLGPSDASGVSLTCSLPNTFSANDLLSSSLPLGNLDLTAFPLVVGDLKTLPVGSNALLTLVVRAPNVATVLASTATVSAGQADANLTNNEVSILTLVTNAFPFVSPGDAVLVSESSLPTNGVIDPGEKVSVQFYLKNTGTIQVTNVQAILQAGGGVTHPLPLGSLSYGDLMPGQTSSNVFTFTAQGTNGGVISATLLVTSGANVFTNVFLLPLPVLNSYTNSNAITIPDIGMATPYPSTLVVSGVTGLVERVTATLWGFSHTYPHDVSVLLVSPSGRKSLLMAHPSLDVDGVANIDLTFDQTASVSIPLDTALTSGSYKPAVYLPVPIFTNAVYANVPLGPYSANLSTFNSIDPNGTWSLYIVDEAQGDSGSVAGGWSLAVTTINPRGNVADLGLAAIASADQVIQGDQMTYTVTITNSGPNLASDVRLNNLLPAGMSYVSGPFGSVLNGQTLTCDLGSLAVGSKATASLVVRVTSTNSLYTDTVSVSANEVDLNGFDNTASLSTVGALPTADVTVGISGPSTVGVNGSNGTLAYVIAVTNLGPNDALNVVVTNPLPAGVAFYSASVMPSGSYELINQTVGNVTNYYVRCDLGTIASGSTATVQVAVSPMVPSLITNRAVVSTGSIDPITTNNTASFATMLVVPGPTMEPAGVQMIAESFSPPNGVVEPGETVTLQFTLKNSGTGPATNLTAALQATGGVLSTGVQTFGPISVGTTASKPVTFTTSTNFGSSLAVTFVLKDGSRDLGSVTFSNLMAPVQLVSTQTNGIVIPSSGPASPYPSTIIVSNQTGVVSRLAVTLNNLTHTFPSDVNVMLVGPQGQKIMLMSHAGGAYAANNLTLTFTNSGAYALPAGSQLSSGVFLPSTYGYAVNFPGDASVMTLTALSEFYGMDPNGSWSLFVLDDSPGDGGVISGGWSLALTLVQPLNPVANLSVQMQAPAVGFSGALLVYTNTVSNNGPSDANNVMLAMTLPADSHFVSADLSQGSYTTNATGQLLCNFGTMSAAGRDAQVIVQVLAGQPGSAVSTATVSSDATDLDLTDNSASSEVPVLGLPHLWASYSQSNAVFHVKMTGQPGLSYALQGSTNLMAGWLDATNFVLPANGVTYDVHGVTNPANFYRARILP